MSVKYHINPERGPLRCTASSPERCKYGSDAPHFSTVGEAEKVWQDDLADQYGTLGGAQKRRRASAIAERDDFLRNIDDQLPSDINVFTDDSRDNHNAVSRTIDDRCQKSAQKFKKLSQLAPVPGVSGSSSIRGWVYAREEYRDYLDRTADLVEAHTQSRFYRSVTEAIDPSATVGNSTPARVVLPGSFIDNSVVRSVDARSLIIHKVARRVKQDYDLHNRRTAIWGRRLIDDYAAQHPELNVSRLSGHYVSNTVKGLAADMNNVAILSSKEDTQGTLLYPLTTSNPDNWNDVPDSVRMNALYALYVTNLEQARIRVLVNDHEIRDYTVHRDDEVVSGSGIGMRRYLSGLQRIFTRTA